VLGASGVPAEPLGYPTFIFPCHRTIAREVGVIRFGRHHGASGFEFVRVDVFLSATYGATFPMDSDRKYRQHGYMDTDRDSRGPRDDRPRPQGPRPPIDITGPRLPRLVQHVAAPRCFNCSTALPAGIDLNGTCPKCNAELHCCKQCSHFEPSTRFQCLKPIPVRIPSKDKANECALFTPRVTVARDGTASAPPISAPPVNMGPPAPRNADDARNAFDRLFKKE